MKLGKRNRVVRGLKIGNQKEPTGPIELSKPKEIQAVGVYGESHGSPTAIGVAGAVDPSEFGWGVAGTAKNSETLESAIRCTELKTGN